MPTPTRPIAVYHEHQDWFRPLFDELDRRWTPPLPTGPPRHPPALAPPRPPLPPPLHPPPPPAHLLPRGRRAPGVDVRVGQPPLERRHLLQPLPGGRLPDGERH